MLLPQDVVPPPQVVHQVVGIESVTVDGQVYERKVRIPVIKRVAIFHRKAIGRKARTGFPCAGPRG
jgi:hypothetical protein